MAYLDQIKLGDTTYDIGAWQLIGNASPSAVPLSNPGNGRIKYYYNINNGLTGNMPSTNNANGILHLNTHGGEYSHQLGFSSDGNIYQRATNGSTLSSSVAWKKILNSSNYTDYTVTKTGSGASGTWGINITGNAASASSVAWGNISGKPSTFPPSSHNHDGVYAKLAAENNFVHAGNEWTVVPSGYSGSLWLNYRTCGGTNGDISYYYFGNGKGGYGGVTLVADTFSGNAASSSCVKDYNSNTPTYFGYSTSGMDSATWIAAWDSSVSGQYRLRAIQPSKLSVNYANSAGAVAWGNVTGKPSTFTPSSHTHSISNITNLQTNLDNKAGGGNYGDITVAGNANTYYPVVLSNVSSYYPMQFVNISRTYNETAPDSWNTSTHKGGLTMTLLWNGSRYWDGNGAGSPCFCVYKYESYSTMVGGLGNSSSGIVVWLRGGTANYHIHSLNGKSVTATVYLSTFTDGAGNSFAPKTSPDTVSVRWPGAWMRGDAVTGAVWNDYAEYRESDCKDFGYVLMESGDDSLTKTTERLSHFAGVSSDTWGFSQGETDKAKTPIAVAGRVLVYPYQDRNNYKPGDCVCAAPGGTVDIMTREEVINWPDRIIGTVSCVPDYEEWGGGDGADREPVKVDGRIWIKVK